MLHTDRRRGKNRSRVLYWFRTPPGVRVGRSALDEDAIRLIEASNPDLEFDWTSILKGQDASSQESAPPPNDRRARFQRNREARPQPAARAAAPRQDRVPDVQPGTRNDPPPQADPGAPSEPSESAGPDSALETAALLQLSQSGDPDPAGPASNELTAAASEEFPATAAISRLGIEGVTRLRARHAEVLARISEKVADPESRDELKSQAERLNPDTWVTTAEVTAGLESYESVFESLRGVVGRRRKRRRPGGGRDDAQQQSTGADAGPGQPGAKVATDEDELTGDGDAEAGKTPAE